MRCHAWDCRKSAKYHVTNAKGNPHDVCTVHAIKMRLGIEFTLLHGYPGVARCHLFIQKEQLNLPVLFREIKKQEIKKDE